jgi:hypothetical protein
MTHGHSTRIGKVGQYRSKTYICWIGMKMRCLNKNHKYFYRYGGRGITVCDRWVNSFENFILDMGEKPTKMTLERVNNDMGYYPENCKWITLKENANNRNNTRFLELNGLRLPIMKWVDKTGLCKETIKYRLKSGWSIEKTLTKRTNYRSNL